MAKEDKIEQADWILKSIRESLEKIREARKELDEWDTVAQDDDMWE
jgi:hypothetical protein